jgi:hypothetical protein
MSRADFLTENTIYSIGCLSERFLIQLSFSFTEKQLWKAVLGDFLLIFGSVVNPFQRTFAFFAGVKARDSLSKVSRTTPQYLLSHQGEHEHTFYCT